MTYKPFKNDFFYKSLKMYRVHLFEVGRVCLKCFLMGSPHLHCFSTVLDCICNFTSQNMSGGATKGFAKKNTLPSFFFKVIFFVSIPESVYST